MWLLIAILMLATAAEPSAKKLEKACLKELDAEACYLLGQAWFATEDERPHGVPNDGGRWFGLACVQGHSPGCSEAAAMAPTGWLPVDLRRQVVSQMRADCQSGAKEGCQNLGTILRSGTQARVVADSTWVEGEKVSDLEEELRQLAALTKEQGLMAHGDERLVRLQLHPDLPSPAIVDAAMAATGAGYSLLELQVGEFTFNGRLFAGEPRRDQLVLLVDKRGIKLARGGDYPSGQLADVDEVDVPCLMPCSSAGAIDLQALSRRLGEFKSEHSQVFLCLGDDVPANIVVAVGGAARVVFHEVFIIAHLRESRVDNPELVIVGSLSPEAISTTIKANRADIDQCWNEHEALAGQGGVRFVIGGDGVVTGATVKGSGEGLQEAFECLKKEIESWTFPPPEGGGSVIVTYSL